VTNPSTLVSCLMVTADRVDLARRAVSCFIQQHHANRELVVVDDGNADYRPMLRAAEAFGAVKHVKLPATNRRKLGDLRNVAIEAASGDWCVQWDDDEWYHPDRIGRQLAAALASGTGASALKWTLMHVPTTTAVLRFRADTGIATPGTLLFRRSDIRYPALARSEDAVFMRDVRSRLGLAVLGRESSHLFVRVFHGGNTWDERHFLRRLRRTPADAVSWAVATCIHRDVTRHRAFRLDAREIDTFTNFDHYDATHAATPPRRLVA